MKGCMDCSTQKADSGGKAGFQSSKKKAKKRKSTKKKSKK